MTAPDSSVAAAPRLVVEPAGLRRRLASMLYESLLLLGVLALVFLVPWLALGIGLGVAPPGWLAWMHLFIALGVYFIWYWRRGGQTLAMQTWRLRIVDAASGRQPGLGQCLLRYALAWPSVMLFGVGLLWALVDRDRQFLHDRLAGTVIVLLPGNLGAPK
ncbi:MAG TPA: RDD family protein [Pseudothauera hydrothermalis]|uniref:RDD family protein n=1 Tax=Pseudothauera hydrothermalis TaxID=2184083 RepID=UPI000E09873E|nr:RDD family protein [Pseudothauera hydrothermalis]HNQ75303.1 RDD family protein [Pseudothauera hydrothermalis]